MIHESLFDKDRTTELLIHVNTNNEPVIILQPTNDDMGMQVFVLTDEDIKWIIKRLREI